MTEQTQIFIGVDVSKNWLDIANNKQLYHIDNTATALAGLLGTLPKGATLVYEATGGYEHTLEKTALGYGGIMLKRVHPSRVKSFARACGRQAKTDKIDAQMLARFGAFDDTPAMCHTDAAIAALNRRRRQLGDMIQAEKNRKNKAPEEIKGSYESIIKTLQKQLCIIEKNLNQAIENNTDLSSRKALLKSVKGVGDTVANALIAALPELGKRDHKQLAALIGIAPQTRQSGMKRWHSKTGHGRTEVRKALYMAALVGIRHNIVLKDFYQKLTGKGKKPKVALVACMRKLLVILNGIVKSNKPWKYA